MKRLLPLALTVLVPSLAWAQDEAPPEDAPITKLPSLKTGGEAKFPKAALRDRVAAKVTLAIDIGADGYVENVEPVETTTVAETPIDENGQTKTSTLGDYGFTEAAIIAAAQLEFNPAESNGTPVPVRISYSFNFALPAPPAPPPLVTTASTATTAAPPPGPGIVNFKGTIRERGSRSRVAGVVVTVFQGEGDDAIGYESITNDEGGFEF